MGIYRATLNMPGLGINKEGTFNDSAEETRRYVMFGHLVPVDAVAKRAVRQRLNTPIPPAANSRDAIMAALAAAKAQAAEAGPPEVAQVETSIPTAAPAKKSAGRPRKNPS